MKISCLLPSAAYEIAVRGRDALLSLFYPSHCAQCQADTPAGEHLCGRCAAEAIRVVAPFCHQCSQPFAGAITTTFTCVTCEGRDFHFRSAVARYVSRGVVRDFVHRFKYNGNYYLRHQLAAWMAEGLEDDRLLEPKVDIVVPVPLHPARQREREFNQAEVLARLISAPAGLTVSNCLRRLRYTTTQTRLNREARMENLRGAFALRAGQVVTGRHVLLVDDVFTTGSTVDECSRVLLEAGAASVRVLTAARA